MKRVRAIIFDLDGTVVEAPYDWKEIRRQMGIDQASILSTLNGLKGPEKLQKLRLLDKFEKEATQKATLKEGIKDFLCFLKQRGLRIALVTNNSRENVDLILSRFGLRFDEVMTRESGLWKPSGAPFLEVMRKLGVRPEECVVIGDSRFDFEAGQEAGVPIIFLFRPKGETSALPGAQFFPSFEALQRKFIKLLETELGKRASLARKRKRRGKVIESGAKRTRGGST